ncbi:probable 26S proteasome non-ATPase regulatory subunit 3 [Olea europaea subsp. europaea]|uniref:Probable 26S proteasome non-ATPase regulatory subunit 3 n=1 Tax=Olea europaea subsp. europaea TaxID=158383 RepID=A0A8S0SGI1_OLEEU|nr:probable 26S proteasome non-ATPase regulatory subunit 3 [Olea europaea subsp. europaea]
MQETLLNLLLRNFLHYNLYDQAEKLSSKGNSVVILMPKSPFPKLPGKHLFLLFVSKFNATSELLLSTLLLGEIPERTVFMQKGMEKVQAILQAYKCEYGAVRIGDLKLFITVAERLRLDSANPVADSESIVAKAIRDGAIDATLDHANGCLISKETGDIYSTNEPQSAFNS